MAADVFLKLTEIPGDSTDDKFKNQIEVMSFSSGVSMPAGPRSYSGSAPNERASFSDFSITKGVDSSSPALFKAACIGKNIDEAVLSVNRSDSKSGDKITYMTYTMNDCMITTYQASGSDGSGLPVESFSLNYAKIQVQYQVTDKTGAPKGAKVAGWDVALHKAI
jgi:type VI secretion system secreted protein Hcp